jgi:hypothetical protein
MDGWNGVTSYVWGLTLQFKRNVPAGRWGNSAEGLEVRLSFDLLGERFMSVSLRRQWGRGSPLVLE